MLVVGSRRLSSIVSSTIRLLFLDMTCFIIENALSHTNVLPHIECIFVQNLTVWEIYLC